MTISLTEVVEKGDPYNERDYPKIPDDDPLDYYGHGTHVAGIIAADSERHAPS
jgi:subtilisin family serine protease